MKKITMRKAKAKRMKEKAGAKHVRAKFYEKLIEKHGFSHEPLGTGYNAYTCSGDVGIMTF